MSEYTDLFGDESGGPSSAWRQLTCAHWSASDVDADGRRICLGCGAVMGPPPDLAADVAAMYLTALRQVGIEITEEHETFAADLARCGKPSL